MTFFLIFARCALGVTFAVSFGGKVWGARRYAAFTAACGELAPWAPKRLVAPLVVAAELAVVAALAVPVTVQAGLALAVLLLAAFTVAIIGVLRRRRQVACQCFGTSSSPLGSRHVVRNVLLLMVAVGAVATGEPAGASQPVEVLVPALLAGGAVGAAVAFLDDIAELFLPIKS